LTDTGFCFSCWISAVLWVYLNLWIMIDICNSYQSTSDTKMRRKPNLYKSSIA